MASMQVLRIGPAALLLRVVCVVFVTAASVGVIVTAYVPPLADRRSVRKRLFSSNPKWATVDKKIGAADTDLWTTQLGTLRVPLVGTGTLSWSSKSFNRLENEDLQSLIDEALKEKHQSGDNNRGTSLFLDTAERYGSNWKTALGLGWGETEELIRQLVQRSPSHSSFSADSKMEREDGATSSKLTVATKFTPTPWRTTVQSVVDACNASRQRLGVDQIDLYMVNMPDIVQPLNKLRPGSVTTTKDEVYWQGLAECYHRGLVKNIGVCNYGPTLLARCQDVLSRHKNAVVPLACNQISYSLLGRQQGAQETIQYCRKEGIKVMAAYPLAMGLLTSKYYTSSSSSNGPENETSNTSLRTSAKSALETRDLRGYAERIQPLLSVMADIAQSRQKSMAQVALNYITCQGVIPIPGARTVEQFQDNAGSMGWSLTATELARLEQAADALQLNFDGAGFKRTSEKFVGYGMEKFALD